MSPRILLLQARLEDDPMREHEERCFVERTGLAPDAVVTHDLCGGPPTLDEVRGFEALMVGGSGEFYVTKGNLPHFERFLEFLREVVDAGHPMFASCFGFGGLVLALGGAMVHDPDNREVGTYELELTAQGRADPLFGALPERFRAQMGHKDRACRLPDGVLNLAATQRCPIQALRVPGKPIWSTQFHPELDREANLDRFRSYVAAYATDGDAEDIRAASDRFTESPEASGLLSRFLDLVAR